MSSEPAYQRIAGRLRDEINTGKWKPGDKLPSHAELAESLGVSVTTARNAVLELVKENLLYTATSRGTIVRSDEVLEQIATAALQPDRPTSTFDAFVETARAAGRTASKQFSVKMEPANPHIARWLGITPNDWVYARTVVQYLDNEPWSQEISYYPRDLAESTGLDTPHDIPEGTIRRLAATGHAEIAHRDTLQARPATPDEAAVLGIATGTMILEKITIAASRDHITCASVWHSIAIKNRTIYELGDPEGLRKIRAVLEHPKDH